MLPLWVPLWTSTFPPCQPWSCQLSRSKDIKIHSFVTVHCCNSSLSFVLQWRVTHLFVRMPTRSSIRGIRMMKVDLLSGTLDRCNRMSDLSHSISTSCLPPPSSIGTTTQGLEYSACFSGYRINGVHFRIPKMRKLRVLSHLVKVSLCVIPLTLPLKQSLNSAIFCYSAP